MGDTPRQWCHPSPPASQHTALMGAMLLGSVSGVGPAVYRWVVLAAVMGMDSSVV